MQLDCKFAHGRSLASVIAETTQVRRVVNIHANQNALQTYRVDPMKLAQLWASPSLYILSAVIAELYGLDINCFNKLEVFNELWSAALMDGRLLGRQTRHRRTPNVLVRSQPHCGGALYVDFRIFSGP